MSRSLQLITNVKEIGSQTMFRKRFLEDGNLDEVFREDLSEE